MFEKMSKILSLSPVLILTEPAVLPTDSLALNRQRWGGDDDGGRCVGVATVIVRKLMFSEKVVETVVQPTRHSRIYRLYTGCYKYL